MDVPVLIVGGGPTGLTLGALLTRAGIEFLLVEKNPGTCTHPQAHAISGRTMEIFRSLDIHEDVYRRGLDMLRFGGLRIVTSLAGNELARIAPRLDPEQIAAMTGFSPCPGTSTPQDLIEPLLAGKLAGGPGRLRFSTELVGFRLDADGVAATLTSGGRRQSVRARWMVACDGASSGIREEMGIATEGPPPLGQIIGIYFHADLMRWPRDRPAMLYWTIDSELPATFIALDGRERWSLHVSWDPETESLSERLCRELRLDRVDFRNQPRFHGLSLSGNDESCPTSAMPCAAAPASSYSCSPNPRWRSCRQNASRASTVSWTRT